jgi:hypothetical protein
MKKSAIAISLTWQLVQTTDATMAGTLMRNRVFFLGKPTKQREAVLTAQPLLN